MLGTLRRSLTSELKGNVADSEIAARILKSAGMWSRSEGIGGTTPGSSLYMRYGSTG